MECANGVRGSIYEVRVLVSVPDVKGMAARQDVMFRITDNATHEVETMKSMFVTGEP